MRKPDESLVKICYSKMDILRDLSSQFFSSRITN